MMDLLADGKVATVPARRPRLSWQQADGTWLQPSNLWGRTVNRAGLADQDNHCQGLVLLDLEFYEVDLQLCKKQHCKLGQK